MEGRDVEGVAYGGSLTSDRDILNGSVMNVFFSLLAPPLPHHCTGATRNGGVRRGGCGCCRKLDERSIHSHRIGDHCVISSYSPPRFRILVQGLLEIEDTHRRRDVR